MTMSAFNEVDFVVFGVAVVYEASEFPTVLEMKRNHSGKSGFSHVDEV